MESNETFTAQKAFNIWRIYSNKWSNLSHTPSKSFGELPKRTFGHLQLSKLYIIAAGNNPTIAWVLLSIFITVIVEEIIWLTMSCTANPSSDLCVLDIFRRWASCEWTLECTWSKFEWRYFRTTFWIKDGEWKITEMLVFLNAPSIVPIYWNKLELSFYFKLSPRKNLWARAPRFLTTEDSFQNFRPRSSMLSHSELIAEGTPES